MKTKVTEKYTFSFESPISSETTSSNTLLAEKVRSDIIIDIDSNGEGFATWSIPELEIEDAIGLWFTGNTLTDYDGVFELPKQVIDKLRELGYDLTEL